MSDTVRKTDNRGNNNLPAGVAGASSGTLLLLLAQNLPDSLTIKSWLIIVAPSLSVILTWGIKKIERYFKNKLVESLIKKVKVKIEDKLKNPHLSEEDKTRLKKQLVEIDLADIDMLRNRIRSISIEND